MSQFNWNYVPPMKKTSEMKKKINIREETLDTAKSIVTGARANEYGGVEDNFKRIGKLWEAYKGVAFSTEDVALMLALLKVARLKNSPDHKDSWIDIAGYAACGAECALKTETEILKAYVK